MGARRERARARARVQRRRAIRSLLVAVAVGSGFLGLSPGIATANHGGNTVTPVAQSANKSECPDGGLKLDGINDKVIHDGPYGPVDGITIVISNSEHDGDTLSFDWTATTPEGTEIDYVVVKAGQDDKDTEVDESRTNIEPTDTNEGSVSVPDSPWYSHISFCLGDGDGDGDGSSEEEKCPDGSAMPSSGQCKCPDGSTMPSNGDCDSGPEACPNDATKTESGVDSDRDGIDDACETSSSTNDDDDNDNIRSSDDDDDGEVLGETTERRAPEPEPEVAAAPATAEVSGEVVATAQEAPATLPRTGGPTRALLQLASVLITAGLVLTRIGRTRTSKA